MTPKIVLTTSGIILLLNGLFFPSGAEDMAPPMNLMKKSLVWNY